ncbi:hypothetical protein RB598_002292 [Gaeumannomyces tritici]
MSASTRLHSIRAMRCTTPAARAITSGLPGRGRAAPLVRFCLTPQQQPQQQQQQQQQQSGYRYHSLGGQRRWGSTTSQRPTAATGGAQHAGKNKGPPPPRRPTFGEVLRRLFRDSLGSLSRAVRGENFRAIFRQHPGEMGLALISLVVMAGVVAYTVRIYFTYFYSEQFTTLPAPVADAMRRALYYSNYAPDPKLALKYYREAIERCVQAGLDPFSDEFMGVRIQVAAWLEKIERYDAAIRTLTSLLDECRRWVALAEERGMKELPVVMPAATEGQEEGKKGEEAAAPRQKKETVWGKRNRILRRSIGISVKLGELYSDQHVLEPELAHESLVWAVEAGLREMRRRSVEGVKEGEGEWLNAEEMGGALEALGTSFLSKDQAHLAVPAFLQALHLCQDPCHSAVIMNNIAASFVQHPLHTPLVDPLGPAESAGPAGSGGNNGAVLGDGGAKTSDASKSAMAAPAPTAAAATRATYLEYAGNWADNARRLAAETSGDKRTPECDQACAVSLCNLGDIAKMLGDAAGARRRFDECIALSERIGFDDGVRQAKAGLRALDR